VYKRQVCMYVCMYSSPGRHSPRRFSTATCTHHKYVHASNTPHASNTHTHTHTGYLPPPPKKSGNHIHPHSTRTTRTSHDCSSHYVFDKVRFTSYILRLIFLKKHITGRPVFININVSSLMLMYARPSPLPVLCLWSSYTTTTTTTTSIGRRSD